MTKKNWQTLEEFLFNNFERIIGQRMKLTVTNLFTFTKEKRKLHFLCSECFDTDILVYGCKSQTPRSHR